MAGLFGTIGNPSSCYSECGLGFTYEHVFQEILYRIHSSNYLGGNDLRVQLTKSTARTK